MILLFLAGDLSLEDDDQGLGSHSSNSAVIATLVAINNRSLLELNIDIVRSIYFILSVNNSSFLKERMFTVDPSIATAPITPTTNSAPTQALGRNLLGQSETNQQQGQSSQQLTSFHPPPPPPPPQPSAELMQHFQQQRQNQHQPYEALTEIMGGGSTNKK